MKTTPLAGKPAQPAMRVDVPGLVAADCSDVICAESCRGVDHLRRTQEEAKTIVSATPAAPTQ